MVENSIFTILAENMLFVVLKEKCIFQFWQKIVFRLVWSKEHFYGFDGKIFFAVLAEKFALKSLAESVILRF